MREGIWRLSNGWLLVNYGAVVQLQSGPPPDGMRHEWTPAELDDLAAGRTLGPDPLPIVLECVGIWRKHREAGGDA